MLIHAWVFTQRCNLKSCSLKMYTFVSGEVLDNFLPSVFFFFSFSRTLSGLILNHLEPSPRGDIKRSLELRVSESVEFVFITALDNADATFPGTEF